MIVTFVVRLLFWPIVLFQYLFPPKRGDVFTFIKCDLHKHCSLKTDLFYPDEPVIHETYDAALLLDHDPECSCIQNKRK